MDHDFGFTNISLRHEKLRLEKKFPHFHSFYFLNWKAEKELTGSSQERLKLNGSVSYLLPDETIRATEASIVL